LIILNEKAGDIIKDIITKYTSGFTTAHVSDGPTITRIAFNYIQVSEAITKIAETCGYEWYIDYDKDIYFFLKTDYPASFQLDDDQEYYKDLIINTDISQLRNRVYVKSSKYETLDFTELFIGDGSTVTWTCKYQANALPSPSLKLNGVDKTVGWDGVDNPDDYDFMLNATTKVLSLGTFQSTPADGDEIVITYGADVPIIVRWDDEDSIEAIKAIEGGDGIFEHCITDNNIDTKEWAIDVAKADLLQNANPVIQGNFITNQSDVRSGQIITLNSTKRNINQDFLIQKVELIRVDVYQQDMANVPYKPAATATIGYKPAAEAEIPYRYVEGEEIIYYVYQVTIATKLKGLEDLLLQLIYQSSESLKRDTEAPAVPTGLALSTGMGSITQASLAWLKATWDANSEDDFSHYELKYKKTAYSDFGYVTTTDNSFLWTGLEQNIEYEVYIRAVDIYGNRSAWSSQVTQVTATDSETPAQITGVIATALFNGVKINWDRATEDNIAGYIVERQESPDNIDWTGAWTERVRLEATMWLDLFLTYTKWYRYRVTAYTQTGTEGTTSSPSNAVQPKQAATEDIEQLAITASLLAAGAVTEGKIATGAVTEGKVGTAAISEIKLAVNAVTETKLGANAVTEGKIAANAVTENKIKANAVIADKIAANAVTTDKLNALAVTAGKIATDAIESTKIKANAVTAEKILAGAIGTDKLAALAVNADKIAANAIVSDKIASLAITTDKIAASAITTAKINAGAVTTDCIAANAITADLIAANSIYTNALQAGAVIASKIAANAIESDKIKANAVTADKIDVSNLSAITATLGTVHSGTIYGTRIQVGSGTNEDIYFEDSGVRMYDAGSRVINIYKSGYKMLSFLLASAYTRVAGGTGYFVLNASGKVLIEAGSSNFNFHTTGTLQLPKLGDTAPTEHDGDIAVRTSHKGLRLYDATYGWNKASTYTSGW